MSDGAVQPRDLEELAVELATGAAAVVRSGGSAVVTAKSSATDLVTETDRASEAWLRDRLAVQRPDDAILGEESGGSAGRSGLRWLLDPIDGTVNFVLGLPQYAVSVAVEDAEGTVAGAVCNPVTGELFTAARGTGARRNGSALTGPRAVTLDRAVIATGFAYRSELRRAQGEVVARLLGSIADIRRMGAASLDLCAVAAGRVDGYFEAGLHPWDYAAGMLIATEAGCVASGLRGAAPGPRLVAVAAAGLVPEFFDLLAALGADRVSNDSGSGSA